MKKILHIIPTLKYGGISSVVCNWHDIAHGSLYKFDYISFNDGPLREKFTKDGSNVTVIPTIRHKPILYMYMLFKIILKENYDAIHVHNSFKNGFVLLLAWALGVKVRVCHSHTSGLEDKTLKLYLPILKLIAVVFSNVRLACGNDAGLFLYGNKKFNVINNTINLDRIFKVSSSKDEVKNKYNLPAKKTLIGHVGRFSDVKNHHFIIDVASKMTDEFHFVLVGEGPEKRRITDYVKEKKLSNRFTFINPTTEVPELLSAFDIFVLPSKFEGVSMALLEAQAAGLSCLASNKVPLENDVGLDLVEFLPIDDPTLWGEKINKCNRLCSSHETKKTIDKFNLAGLTNTALYHKLMNIYD